jgi:hypothetical protein
VRNLVNDLDGHLVGDARASVSEVGLAADRFDHLAHNVVACGHRLGAVPVANGRTGAVVPAGAFLQAVLVRGHYSDPPALVGETDLERAVVPGKALDHVDEGAKSVKQVEL